MGVLTIAFFLSLSLSRGKGALEVLGGSARDCLFLLPVEERAIPKLSRKALEVSVRVLAIAFGPACQGKGNFRV